FKTNHHPDEDYRVALLTCRRIYAAASPTFKLICKKKYLRRLIRDISECREIYRQIRVDKSDHINRVFISKAIQDNVLTPISALVKGRRRIIREVGAAKMGFLLGGPPGTGKSLLGHYIQSYIRQLL